MPQPRRERPGRFAAVPDDTTDPLLWRLAIDVLAAHQPAQDGNCRNLQCAENTGPCTAATAARRAIQLAQSPAHPSDHRQLPVRRQARPKPPARSGEHFIGWFTTPAPAARVTRQPDPVPERGGQGLLQWAA